MAVPEAFPVTTPDELMLAIEASERLQVPPVPVLANVIVAATHTLVAPDMVPASGRGLTVTAFVATALPQLLLTV
jgi:hypothetical protein